MNISLNYVPRAWQRKVHEGFRRFNVVVAHRRSGKTLLALMQLLDAAVRSTHDGSLFAYVAPFAVQARRIAWGELKRIVAHLGPRVVTVSESDLSVTFAHNGARIMLAGADNADALRGLRLDGVVVDEIAFIRPEVWTDVLRPTLADRGGWAMFIGTPSGVNLFSELFHKATGPEWFAARFTVFDTHALPADEVERLQREMPVTSFAREFLCDFSAQADDQLLCLGDVEAAARRTIGDVDISRMPRIMGIDPARYGGDRSVIAVRQGLRLLPPVVLRGVGNMELAARAAHEITVARADGVFCDAGAGAGVIDRLRQLGYQVTEVPFGGRPHRAAEFANRRAEMASCLAEWIRGGGCIPDDPALRLELATPTFRFDAQGRRVLESKDDIRKRMPGGASCDLFDAVALTFAAPPGAVRSPADRLDDSYRPRVVRSSGDPLDYVPRSRGNRPRGLDADELQARRHRLFGG